MGTPLSMSITKVLQNMDHATQNNIATFLWNIAGDVLRDLCVGGKYRDVILHDGVRRSCSDPS